MSNREQNIGVDNTTTNGSGMDPSVYDAANLNQQLVGVSAPQTITNKIFTTPVINSPSGIVKGDVGLGSVDNTSDANKPVSTAQSTADNLRLLKTNNLSDLANVTTAKTNLSLQNVNNTSDATKNSATANLTNKKVVPQVQSVVSSATVTPTDKNNLVEITALAVGLTLANATGALSDGQGLMVRIKDNGTSRTLAFGTIYKATDLALPSATVVNETLYLGFIYNSADSTLDLIGIRRK